ncbi:MAG: hypothetical protein JO141_27235 [Bradyrhizobium sp.]|nr:hypothetical protein [Bradyrhizobium sp.]
MRELPADRHNESIDNRGGRIPFPSRAQAGWKRWCERASSMMDLRVPLETTKALDSTSSIRALSRAAASVRKARQAIARCDQFDSPGQVEHFAASFFFCRDSLHAYTPQ